MLLVKSLISFLAYERNKQYPIQDVPKEPVLANKDDEADNYEQLLQKYQDIKEKLAEIQSQEKAVQEPVRETSTQEKPEDQKPTASKSQPIHKITPRKPETKVVVDITGEVAKEKVPYVNTSLLCLLINVLPQKLYFINQGLLCH